MESGALIHDRKPAGRDTGRIILWSGLFAVTFLSILVIVPLDFPPLVDYPVHLALFKLAPEIGRTDDACAGEFTFRWFTPYSALYLLARLTGSFIPATVFAKSVLAFYIAMTPLSFMLLLHVTNRPLNYALFIPMMLFNFNFSWGFLPFLAAIPMIFCATALAVRASDRRSLAWFFAYALLIVGIFFTHLFAWMIAILLSGAAIMMSKRRGIVIRYGAFALANLPAVVMMLVWRSQLAFTRADETFLVKKIQIPSPWVKLRFFPDFIISGDPGWGARYLFFGMLGIALLYFAVSMRRETTHHPAQYMIPLSAVIAYFLCPYSGLTAVWLFNRIGFFAAASLILLLPSYVRFRPVLDGFLVLLSIVLIIHMAGLYFSFDEEAASAFNCMERVPPDQRLACLVPDSRSQFTDHSVYDHFDQFHQTRFGGCVLNPFALLAHMPIHYREETIDRQERFRIQYGSPLRDDQFEEFDRFLVRVPDSTGGTGLTALFRNNLPRLQLMHQSGQWVLLRKIGQSR